jgi:hypothetical protein
MMQRIHQKLGTAGFIISIVALVAALGGGAYAASGGLNGKQKKEVEKIAKSVSKSGKAGPAGPTGAAGPAGTTGAKGDAGAAGAKGETGSAGAPGSPGTPGKNGTNGQTGFTETLPGGKTETGSWIVGMTTMALPVNTSISFTIPLAEPLDETHVHYVKAGEGAPVGCTGGNASAPVADPGNLCVYETRLTEGPAFHLRRIFKPSDFNETPGATQNGAILQFEGSEEATAWGTWAVTAEEE